MNQEQVARRLTDISKVTGEVFLKFLLATLQESYGQFKEYVSNKTYTGETNWNKFLATSEEKYFKEFLSTELHAEKLKEYLKEHNIGFAMQDLPNGKKEIAIDAKNIQQLENFLIKFKDEITSEETAKSLSERLVKNPQNMPLADKIDRHKKEMNQEIKAKKATKEKAPAKEADKEL